MASFKKLNPRIYAKSGPVLTPDNEYWKKLSVSTYFTIFHNLSDDAMCLFRFQFW